MTDTATLSAEEARKMLLCLNRGERPAAVPIQVFKKLGQLEKELSRSRRLTREQMNRHANI